jgi:hypothetical protein
VEHGSLRDGLRPRFRGTRKRFTSSEESRVLQVSIFETLQKNLTTVDFSLLVLDVMTIADEVDSQLKQTISSFMEKAGINAANRAA